MAYTRRYRSRKSRGKRSVYKKTKPQVSLPVLAKKVIKLEKRQRSIIERVNYTHTADTTVSSNYHAEPLFTPVSWQSVFGESVNVQESKKLNISTLHLDWSLEPGRESSQIDYTIFLITPRSQKIFDETNGMQQFQNNPNGQQDYTYNGAIGYVNPRRFKIWKVWRCNTAGITTRVTGQIAPDANVVAPLRSVRKWHKMPFKRYLNNTVGQQNWKVIPNDQIPVSCAITLLMLNNNSLTDLENPAVKISALFSCYI